MTVKRHPVLGFFSGLLFGLGLAFVLIALGVVPLTLTWLAGITVAGVVLGVAWAYAAPARGRSAVPPAA